MVDLGDAPRAPVPVLIIDDEDMIRNLLALIVGRAGGRAYLAADGAEARRLLAERTYDCVLVDKNLPDTTGLVLLEEIRQASPTTEVLVVTGYANVESAVEALRLGAFDYIVKPFDVSAVTHRVRLALERRRLRVELDRAHEELRHANADLAQSKEEVKRAYLETVLRLCRATEFRDDSSADHIGRMSRYAGLLARAVAATDEWIESLIYAAPLHDVGNIAVPDAILRKPGPLTPAERKVVQAHVAFGARILEGTTSNVLAMGHEVVLTHHERWDGGGYPRKLHGDEIPLAGRIVAVIDAWDAMSTDRVYRKAMPFDHAVADLRRCSGTAHDPTLVDAFLDSLPQVLAILEESRAATEK